MRPGRVYRSFSSAPSDSYGPFPLIKAFRAHLNFEKMRTRMSRYPGLVYLGKPARGVIHFPDPATITDESLLSFNDGVNPHNFGLDTTGDGTVALADTVVDISAAVTPEDFRDAFFAAWEPVWIAGSLDIQPYKVGADGISFVQSGPGPDNLGWSGGGFVINGADANNDGPQPSEPGEWTGLILGMNGGEDPNGGDAQASPVVTGWRRAMLFGAGFDDGKGGGGET